MEQRSVDLSGATWVRVAGDVGASGVVADDEHDLVVWRTAGGRLCVVDARCPHQWSHLEAEGVVDGDELVCTSHFWRFDTAGNGTKLNVGGRRDEKAPVEVFPCEERGGAVWALLPPDRAERDRPW